MDLVENSGWKKWPPRLPEQPIFYPVLNFPYAEQIARDWNSTQENHAYIGYVTEFDVEAKYIQKFQIEVVGGPVILNYGCLLKSLKSLMTI